MSIFILFQSGEKKVHIIRNRSLSILSDSDLKENNKSEDSTNEEKKEESNDESEKIIIKLSQPEEEVRIKLENNIAFFQIDVILNSFWQRLEQRKRKFGMLDDEEKKRARAARFGISDDSSKKSNTISKTLVILIFLLFDNW